MPIRLIIIAVVFASLSGCAWFSKSGPVVEQGVEYLGPGVEFDSSGRTHIARIVCPTGGWSASHDLTREGWPAHEVFITLTAPGEGSMVTQALTTLLVDTQVRSGTPCRVYIRRADAPPGSLAEGAYELAASTAMPGDHQEQ